WSPNLNVWLPISTNKPTGLTETLIPNTTHSIATSRRVILVNPIAILLEKLVNATRHRYVARRSPIPHNNSILGIHPIQAIVTVQHATTDYRPLIPCTIA